MKKHAKRTISLLSFLVVGLTAAIASANGIHFWESAFNNDGVVTQDTITGFGSQLINISGTGDHSFLAFLDADIEDPNHSWWNEFGETFGTPGTGQSWEIDEPGIFFGDIYDNFWAGTLDNTNAVPPSSPEDVSLALGWGFTLLTDQTATIRLTVSDLAPAGGFYLVHTDPDSNTSFYMYGSLDINGDSNPIVPEPSTILLFASGMLGLVALRRRME